MTKKKYTIIHLPTGQSIYFKLITPDDRIFFKYNTIYRRKHRLQFDAAGIPYKTLFSEFDIERGADYEREFFVKCIFNSVREAEHAIRYQELPLFFGNSEEFIGYGLFRIIKDKQSRHLSDREKTFLSKSVYPRGNRNINTLEIIEIPNVKS